MKRLAIFGLLTCWFLSAGDRKPKTPSPHVEVVEFAVKRTTEGTVEIDGRVRNASEKRLRNLVMIFKALAPGDEVVTTQRGTIVPEILEPEEEAEFHWRMRDPARAVALRVEAQARDERVLVVDKPGPYTIE